MATAVAYMAKHSMCSAQHVDLALICNRLSFHPLLLPFSLLLLQFNWTEQLFFPMLSMTSLSVFLIWVLHMHLHQCSSPIYHKDFNPIVFVLSPLPGALHYKGRTLIKISLADKRSLCMCAKCICQGMPSENTLCMGHPNHATVSAHHFGDKEDIRQTSYFWYTVLPRASQRYRIWTFFSPHINNCPPRSFISISLSSSGCMMCWNYIQSEATSHL